MDVWNELARVKAQFEISQKQLEVDADRYSKLLQEKYKLLDLLKQLEIDLSAMKERYEICAVQAFKYQAERDTLLEENISLRARTQKFKEACQKVRDKWPYSQTCYKIVSEVLDGDKEKK